MLTALSSMMVDALATPTSIAMLFASVVALVLLWVLFLPDQRHVQAFTFDSIKSFAESAPESVAEQLSKSKRWWDDLAPPFSMNSLEEIEHDEDLAVYNSLGAHVAHFCFLFHGYQGRSEVGVFFSTCMAWSYPVLVCHSDNLSLGPFILAHCYGSPSGKGKT
jgi:hypothetical protein